MSTISIDFPVKKLTKSWLFHNELRLDRQTRAPRNTVDFLSRIYRPHTLLIDPRGVISIEECKAWSLIYEEDFSIREKCNLFTLQRLLNKKRRKVKQILTSKGGVA